MRPHSGHGHGILLHHPAALRIHSHYAHRGQLVRTSADSQPHGTDDAHILHRRRLHHKRRQRDNARKHHGRDAAHRHGAQPQHGAFRTPRTAQTPAVCRASTARRHGTERSRHTHRPGQGRDHPAPRRQGFRIAQSRKILCPGLCRPTHAGLLQPSQARRKHPPCSTKR